jgi:hypothetical protein
MKTIIFMPTVLALLYTVQILTVPATVFIIRHGEKTAKKQPVSFKEWILKSSEPLNPRGWQRAYALAPHFTLQPELQKYGTISALFAPKPDSDYESVRPIQTLTPLSDKINITINTDYGLEDACKLVSYIMQNSKFDGKTVLIAYEHHSIPGLAKLFNEYHLNKNCDSTKAVQSHEKKSKQVKVPTTWNNDVFDRIWILGFDTTTSELNSFKNISQQLLMGDAKK